VAGKLLKGFDSGKLTRHRLQAGNAGRNYARAILRKPGDPHGWADISRDFQKLDGETYRRRFFQGTIIASFDRTGQPSTKAKRLTLAIIPFSFPLQFPT